MLALSDWARRHAVSPGALLELRLLMGVAASVTAADSDAPQSESALQAAVRVKAAQQGARLLRNNSGEATDRHGRPVRFGLGNDSKALCKVMKSSDLIGIWPRLVRQEDVGSTLGVFTAIEVKAPGWKYTGSGREPAQLNFINLVLGLGGYAKFVSSLEELQVR